MKAAIAAAVAFALPTLALAQPAPLEPCTLLTTDEVASFVGGVDKAAVKVRSHTTSKGAECTFLGTGQKSLLVIEQRPSKLAKYDLDQEAETLQKIYRTSVVPIEKLGDGGFWLPGRRELWFRKGGNIVRVAMNGFTGDAKAAEAKTTSAARAIEARLK